jgi:hypothetical protein
MTLQQHAWGSLLPGGATLAFRDAPTWLEAEAVTGMADVLVAWDAGQERLQDADRYSGVVLFDPRGVRERDLTDRGLPYVRRFGILPSLRNARWFVPLGRAAVATGTIDAFCVPYRPRGRALAVGARALARSGLPLWRHQVWVGLRERPWLETLFRSVLARDDIHFGVASGEWGLRLTPTAAALDPSGRALAFAKLAATPRSESLLRHEAEVLRELARRYPRQPLAPVLLFAGEREGRYVIVQTALPGRTVASSLSPAHLVFLRSLSGGVSRAASQSAFVRALDDELASFPEVGRLFARARAILDDLVVPSTVTHGDFAPHNLRRSGERIVAFDWENATLDGLPLVDLVHHELQVGLVLRDWTVGRALERLCAIASESGMPRARAFALEAAYLADMYLRRVDGGGLPTATWTPQYRERYRELLGRVDRLLDGHER